MPQPVPPDVVQRLRLHAFDLGLLATPDRSTPFTAGWCHYPVPVALASKAGFPHPCPGEEYNLLWYYRCRRCEDCRRNLAAAWSARAQVEARAARRTWLFTGTFDWRHAPWKPGMPMDGPVVYARRETQKFYKRLRKAGAVVRHLTVVEPHTGRGASHGMPHVHALIHDTGTDLLLGRRLVQHCWNPLGHSKATLVSDEAIDQSTWYICKYLTKGELLARIRASVRYGGALRKDGLRPRSQSIGQNDRESLVREHASEQLATPKD